MADVIAAFDEPPRPPAGRSATCSTTFAGGCCRTRCGCRIRWTWATSCRCPCRRRSGRSRSSRPSTRRTPSPSCRPPRPPSRRVVRWLADFAGMGPDAGGTFTIGATEATFSGLASARARALPRASEGRTRRRGRRLLLRARALLRRPRGRAARHRREQRRPSVPSDRRRAIAPEALERLLATERRRVVAVVATAGSTAVGAFDDLDAIGPICAARDIWLHVDGAHGASALFSSSHRHRMAGSSRALAGVGSPQDDADPAGGQCRCWCRRGGPRRRLLPAGAVPLSRRRRRAGRQGVRCSSARGGSTR